LKKRAGFGSVIQWYGSADPCRSVLKLHGSGTMQAMAYYEKAAFYCFTRLNGSTDNAHFRTRCPVLPILIY
jgi:hypothetical protein